MVNSTSAKEYTQTVASSLVFYVQAQFLVPTVGDLLILDDLVRKTQHSQLPQLWVAVIRLTTQMSFCSSCSIVTAH